MFVQGKERFHVKECCRSPQVSPGCLMWAGDCCLFPDLQRPRPQRKGCVLRDPETTANRLSLNNFFKKRKCVCVCVCVGGGGYSLVYAVSNLYILYILKHIKYMKQQLLKDKNSK